MATVDKTIDSAAEDSRHSKTVEHNHAVRGLSGGLASEPLRSEPLRSQQLGFARCHPNTAPNPKHCSGLPQFGFQTGGLDILPCVGATPMRFQCR